MACVSAAHISAEIAGGAPSVAQVFTVADGEHASLRNIVANFASVQLHEMGISSWEMEMSDAEELIRSAAERGAGHLLAGNIDVDGNRFKLELQLYETESGGIIGRSRANGRIDLTMDLAVNDAVRSVINAAGDRIPIAERTDRDTGPAGAADGAAKGPTLFGSSLDGSANGARPKPAVAGGRTVVTETPTVTKNKILDIGTGFAPFITVGRAADYFRAGIAADLFVDFRINAPGGHVGLGIDAGYSAFRATGLVLEADNMLVPIGVDVRYSSTPRPFGITFHLNGGVAAMIVETVHFGRLFKVVPYAAGGAGLMMAFSHFMGAAIDMQYTAYFEGSVVIMGLSPSVAVYFSM